MIIRRYLVRQVLATSAVVVGLLALIMLGGRLIRYFGIAAQGRIDASALFTLMAFRLPDFLTLILPLGFFVGLMLVFGRLYVDHEMAVLNGSGISRDRLGILLVPVTLLLIVLEAVIVTQLGPWGNRQFDQLLTSQTIRSGFDLVKPREFVSSGRYTIYASSLSEDRHDLQDIFFYERSGQPNKPDTLILAQRATRVVDPSNTASIVDLTNGRRYQIFPGQPAYSHAEFATYRLRISHETDPQAGTQRIEAMSMSALQKRLDEPVIKSELGWRLSMPWVMGLALVLALPLSQVNPRQGRYHRLFPAIMIFASLVVALMAIKTRISKDKLGLWGYPLVLFSYLVVGLLLSQRQRLAPRIAKRIKRVGKA